MEAMIAGGDVDISDRLELAEANRAGKICWFSKHGLGGCLLRPGFHLPALERVNSSESFRLGVEVVRLVRTLLVAVEVIRAVFVDGQRVFLKALSHVQESGHEKVVDTIVRIKGSKLIAVSHITEVGVSEGIPIQFSKVILFCSLLLIVILIQERLL